MQEGERVGRGIGGAEVHGVVPDDRFANEGDWRSEKKRVS